MTHHQHHRESNNKTFIINNARLIRYDAPSASSRPTVSVWNFQYFPGKIHCENIQLTTLSKTGRTFDLLLHKAQIQGRFGNSHRERIELTGIGNIVLKQRYSG